MKKATAIQLLGGSVSSAAAAIGVTYHAVNKWPEDLPRRICDRVEAALWRQAQQTKRLRKAKPVDPATP